MRLPTLGLIVSRVGHTHGGDHRCSTQKLGWTLEYCYLVLYLRCGNYVYIGNEMVHHSPIHVFLIDFNSGFQSCLFVFRLLCSGLHPYLRPDHRVGCYFNIVFWGDMVNLPELSFLGRKCAMDTKLGSITNLHKIFRFPSKNFHNSDDVIRFCWWRHHSRRFWRIFRSSGENFYCDLSFYRRKLVDPSF